MITSIDKVGIRTPGVIPYGSGTVVSMPADLCPYPDGLARANCRASAGESPRVPVGKLYLQHAPPNCRLTRFGWNGDVPQESGNDAMKSLVGRL
jgi:hypothetical protein